MNTLHRCTWVLGALVSGLVQCGGTTVESSPHDAGPSHDDAAPNADTGASGPGDAGACPGNPAASGVPSDHRATATACAPSTAPPAPDGGVTSCTTSADCGGEAGSLFPTCRAGQCSFDACLTDTDCPSHHVCACSSDYYGGNGPYHPNVCVPSNCQVDSDCGPQGYCSPSVGGYCGAFDGYYCHTNGDTCVNAATDCGDCASACVYAPTVGHFVCGGDECTG